MNPESASNLNRVVHSCEWLCSSVSIQRKCFALECRGADASFGGIYGMAYPASLTSSSYNQVWVEEFAPSLF